MYYSNIMFNVNCFCPSGTYKIDIDDERVNKCIELIENNQLYMIL